MFSFNFSTINSNLNELSSEQCTKSISSATSDLLLVNTSKESCVLCEDSDLLNVNFKVVEEKQIKKNEDIIKNLQTKYSAIANEFSINDHEVFDKFNISDCTKSLMNKELFQINDCLKTEHCNGQSCGRCDY